MSAVLQNEISQLLIESLQPLVNNNSRILIEPYIPFNYLSLGISYSNILVSSAPLSRDMFDLNTYLEKSNTLDSSNFIQIDFVVISNKSPYFNEDTLNSRVNKDKYIETYEILENFNKNNIPN